MKNKLFYLFIIFYLIAFQQNALANNAIYFEGRIASYKQNSYKILKQVKKSFDYNGGLNNVTIILSNANQKQNITTLADGSFHLELSKQALYKVTIQKKGFEEVSFNINTQNVAKEYFCDLNTFLGIEVILIEETKSQKIHHLGTYFFNDKKRNFNFKTQLESDENWIQNNIFLAQKSSEMNYSSFQTIEVNKDAVLNKDSVVTEPPQKTESIVKDLKKIEQLLLKTDVLTSQEIEHYKQLLIQIKQQLAEQKLKHQSQNSGMLIANLEAEILFFEAQLKKAEQNIFLKEQEVILYNKLNKLGLSLFMILLIFTLFIIYSFFEKKRKNKQLTAQNKLINAQNERMNDSLNYAQIIQNSIFKSKLHLNKMHPNNVLFTKAKDIISGDFYWFHVVDGKKILAVADCTGHGVPGAMLTILGNTFLDDIIVKNKETNPAKIIFQLNEKLIQVLEQENKNIGIYGMDIALLVIDDDNQKIKFSGAMNGMYHINSEQKLTEIKGSMISLGQPTNFINDENIECIEIDYNKNDAFFLFTDGYMDQFGGKNNEKLNKEKFEKLLKVVTNNFENGTKIVAEYLEDWKKETIQTDDILILGIKL